MASHDKLRSFIAELIARPHNVDYKEIKWVMDQLGAKPRRARHGYIFKIPGCAAKLLVNDHNNGKSHLPPYCVHQFSSRMIELGLYGEE